MEKNKRLNSIWNNMKQRCGNPKSTAARWYYDKGIRVCEEWEHDFFAFQEWSLQNGYKDNLTIDRIDPNKNYCPSNCRWITRSENSSRARRGSAQVHKADTTSLERTTLNDEYVEALFRLRGLSKDYRKSAYKFIKYLVTQDDNYKDIRKIPMDEWFYKWD